VSTERIAMSEVFGPTLQGEGPTAGHPVVFLRTAGCNLRCRWCDTAYTWDWSGVSDMAREQGGPFSAAEEMSVEHPMDVARNIAGRLRDGDRIVVSGGEPMLQQEALGAVFHHLAMMGHQPGVEVETNGTQVPTDAALAWVTQFNVSPKLSHSGDPVRMRVVPHALRALRDTGRAVWKFVVATSADVSNVATWADDLDLRREDVWVMPLGRDRAELADRYRAIADAAANLRLNMTPRLHVLAWGDERGR